MNELNDPSKFAALLQRFFVERLMQQKNVSQQTVAAYRDTFKLLFAYFEKSLKKSPDTIALAHLEACTILNFLDFLETERRNSIRTRNARLAAIRSFMHFVAMQSPPALMIAQQILAIPMKRYEKPLLGFLSREEINALLKAPDQKTWFGRRDRLLIQVLYNTGARVSELVNVRVSDVSFDGAPSITLHGKGRKQRTLPLWKETVALARRWMSDEQLQPEQFLIPNRQRRQMTRCNVSERLALAVSLASNECPSLAKRNISPHTIRHATAMHMLQSGVDITVIALWLGHESPVTTHGYVEADLSLKERALASIAEPKSKKGRYRPKAAILKFLETL
jgi:integrase/recombinase XerD